MYYRLRDEMEGRIQAMLREIAILENAVVELTERIEKVEEKQPIVPVREHKATVTLETLEGTISIKVMATGADLAVEQLKTAKHLLEIPDGYTIVKE